MKDPKTEQYLNRGQWNWEYHERIDFTEIDLVISEENPARLNRRLDHDRALKAKTGTVCRACEIPQEVIIITPPQPSPGWWWRIRRSFAVYLKHVRLPFLSPSKISKELQRCGNDQRRMLLRYGKYPLTDFELRIWLNDYVCRHPP